MSVPRPHLILVRGDELDPADAAVLRSAFELTHAADEEAAHRASEAAPGAIVLTLPRGSGEGLVQAIVEAVGEGVGVFEHGAGEEFAWGNRRLRESSADVQRIFAATCRLAIERFEEDRAANLDPNERPSRKFNFSCGDSHYETVVSIGETDSGSVRSVVGILIEVTDTQRLQSKVDAIDAAGATLLQIDSASVARLNLAERLRLLEDRITRVVEELLHFDNFEIRLIDRDTKRLELVFLRGLKPLRIGEVLQVSESGNGICGHVAATGQSYVCTDTTSDPLYHEGLDDAASSLTVPLRLHDQVIGVFNIESSVTGAFDDTDRHLAELFGRYVALAMHILDLLVVERFTTNEQLTENVLTEIGDPLNAIRRHATAARARTRSPQAMDDLDRILTAVGDIHRRLEAVITGPKSIVGAEPEEGGSSGPDPALSGKRVLLVDNEPEVLDAIRGFLDRKGCNVTACVDGAQSIDILQQEKNGATFDLVISDVRMGDPNGYEVFRAAKAANDATPVILMTGFGYDPHHSIVRANQEGLHSFLFKPLKAEQLLDAVRSAVGGPAE